MHKKTTITGMLLLLISRAFAEDTNSVTTNIPRNDIANITSLLNDVVKFIWGLIGFIMETLTNLIMSLGLNDFQAQLAIAMMILAFSAWKAGSIAGLVDKIRWVIIFFVALILIGIFTGVIK